MTCRMALMMMCAMVALVAAPTHAEKQWDVGTAISGELENKLIEIAITVDPNNPSTDTISVQNVGDTDHWVDPEQSEGQDEGTEGDSIAGWAPDKCWWWCQGGEVTQGSWTTTWTAPSEGGEYALGCYIDDVPTAIPPGETGSRDDGRHNARTAEPGGGTQGVQTSSAGIMQAGGEQAAAPMAVEVYYTIRCQGQQVVGMNAATPPQALRFAQGMGHPYWCTTVQPPVEYLSAVTGWYEKVEIVGTVHPVPQDPLFEWHQTLHGTVKADGQPTLNPRDGLPMDGRDHDDSPTNPAVFSIVPDADGRIYRIDAPGSPQAGITQKFEDTYEWNVWFGTWVTYKGSSACQLMPDGIMWLRLFRLIKDANGHAVADNWGDYATQ